MALDGNIQALQLCLSRIMAPMKERPINVELPPVETAEDAPQFMAALLGAVASGEIKPADAATMIGMVESHGEALKEAKIAANLRQCEEYRAAYAKTPEGIAKAKRLKALNDSLDIW